MMNKYLNKMVILLVIIILIIATYSTNIFATENESVKLTIIHINDRHGRMDADPFIAQMTKDLRINNEKVLILDAGDTLHGQITTNLTEGASMVELMNAVGYSAMVLGNHDFTFGIDRLMELAEMMDFPLLAANVKKDGDAIFKAYEIFDFDNLRIGIFGIQTPETVAASDPRNMTGLNFEDPEKAAIEAITALKEMDCDIIIALAHLGENELSAPADKSNALAIPGVDIIIDGHSHTKLESGRMFGETLIVQAGEYAEYIGIVEIIFNGGVVSKTTKLIEVSEDLSADELITNKINELDMSVETLTSQVVGYTPFFMEGERADVRTKDTNLANLISDAMLWAADADIAFITGGNIRASIPAGDITMGHVLTTLPYSNLIVTMELSGSVIWEALEHGVSLYPEPEGIYIHISGLYAEFDPYAETGSRIKSVKTLDGKTLDFGKTYKVVMPDFIAVGGDGYSMISEGTNLVYFGGDAEVFVNYLKTNPYINEEAEGRLTIYDGKEDSNSLIFWLLGGLLVVAGAGTVMIVKRRTNAKQ